DGEGLDLGFLGYLFDRWGLHLRFRLGLGLVFPGHVVAVQIETGQVPEVEGLHPVGADQIAVILVTHAPVYPLSVLPTLTLPVEASAGAPPPARSPGLSKAQTPPRIRSFPRHPGHRERFRRHRPCAWQW